MRGIMTPEEKKRLYNNFLVAVEEMRKLQKIFFEKRDYSIVKHAQKAEKNVDELLRIIKNERAKNESRSLFTN